MVRVVDRLRPVAICLLIAVLSVVAPSGRVGASARSMSPPQPAQAVPVAFAAPVPAGVAPPPGTDVPAVTDNPYIPADQNLSDCVGTLERPNCGSAKKSDLRMYLTFAVLMLGMAFIGWRIARLVRKRDRTEIAPDHTF